MFSFGTDEEQIVATPCDYTLSEFNMVFQNLISSGHNEHVTMDLETHGYSFTLSNDREMCQIGYQSLPATANIPYLIEVIDNASNSVLYSANHTFSSTATSYVTPNTPINLQAVVSYRIQRTV